MHFLNFWKFVYDFFHSASLLLSYLNHSWEFAAIHLAIHVNVCGNITPENKYYGNITPLNNCCGNLWTKPYKYCFPGLTIYTLPMNEFGWDIIFDLLFAFSCFVTGSEETQTGPYVRFRRLWRTAEFCFKHLKWNSEETFNSYSGQDLHKYTFNVKALHFEKSQ